MGQKDEIHVQNVHHVLCMAVCGGAAVKVSVAGQSDRLCWGWEAADWDIKIGGYKLEVIHLL